MARPRKPRSGRVVRVRKRDYAAEYARRQARARELGYASYYGRRVRLGKPASASAPRGRELARARGHDTTIRDLARDAEDGDLLIASAVVWWPESKNEVGRWDRRVRIDITLNRMTGSGGQFEYTLHGRETENGRVRSLARQKLENLVAKLERKGVVFSPAPSLDLRRMAASPGDE
jgi:hypothetical protein